MDEEIRKAALDYHRLPKPGKIAITATKGLLNQRDLALAYSPGVAAACEEIVRDPAEAASLTSRANLVAVISNGTAVLGLGAIGPLAGKPVMEGKAVLFKKFAGIDVFDLELDERDPDKLVDMIVALEPTFGGINLEDIKAPECFHIERKCRERMKIPVFHDDQHGTAIIVGAAVINGLRVVGKDVSKVKLVVSGAGAAALACLDLLVGLGVKMENVWVSDIAGVVYAGRKEEMDPNKARYARKTDARTLGEIIEGADIFLGLSAGGVLKPEMVKKMAAKPLILALANPEPEILPDLAKQARPDAIIATGRSDYPNQVNNVLCFPFIFRGALDVGATTINEAMKIAAVKAIADLATAEQSDVVAAAYGEQNVRFGPEYLIPRPFDPRLIVQIAPAVAEAAMDSGVATRPIENFGAYRDSLQQFVYNTGFIMKPLFAAAKQSPQRIVYAEGEDERVLRAVQVVVDEGLAKPILIGRPAVIERYIERHGAAHQAGRGLRADQHRVASALSRVLAGVSPPHRAARRLGAVREDRDAPARDRHRRDGDPSRRGRRHAVRHVRHARPAPALRRSGPRPQARRQPLLRDERADPAEAHDLHLRHLRELRSDRRADRRDDGARGGRDPPLRDHPARGAAVALELRHERPADRGQDAPGAGADRPARARPRSRGRDARRRGAVRGRARSHTFPRSRLKGEANLLIMPTLDAANISFNLLKTAAADGVTIGPILLGCTRPAHILTPSATVRRIVNMTALTVVEANAQRTLFSA